MAITWNNTFDAIPRAGNNPGFGAQAIKDTKEAIVERMDFDHIWGQTETDNSMQGGLHREGSSRVYSDDGLSSSEDRTDNQVGSSTTYVGQVVVDMNVLSSHREQDGEDLVTVNGDYEDQYTKEIKVVIPNLTSGGTWEEATQLATVFSYDQFVDIVQDQVINGVKTFTLSPEVPEDVGVTWTLDTLSDHLYDVEDAAKAVSASEIYYASEDAKLFNLFDPDATDNADVVTDGYVQRDIKCRTIEGEAIYGAVWG